MSVFGVILVRIFLYSVRMRENADQNNPEYGHFLLSETWFPNIRQINARLKSPVK